MWHSKFIDGGAKRGHQLGWRGEWSFEVAIKGAPATASTNPGAPRAAEGGFAPVKVAKGLPVLSLAPQRPSAAASPSARSARSMSPDPPIWR